MSRRCGGTRQLRQKVKEEEDKLRETVKDEEESAPVSCSSKGEDGHIVPKKRQRDEAESDAVTQQDVEAYRYHTNNLFLTNKLSGNDLQ